MNKHGIRFATIALLSLILVILGCDKNLAPLPDKKPRPVQVRTLRLLPPPESAMVSASVASWKTEQIGFEVGGRVEWVAEPNTDIEGRVWANPDDADGPGSEPVAQPDEKAGASEGHLPIGREDRELVFEGTPVARIESERYFLQLASARAEVQRVTQNVKAATIELEKSIPSQKRAAVAEKKLAKIEYDRSVSLVEQDAGAQADVDRDEANYQNAISKIEQLDATGKAREAELLSLQSQLLQARQSLRDAERSLEDCTLYSSFNGQIADVSVVPGSVVAAGNPVATIQMMDPIKIELEVSAEKSRQLGKRQRFPVWITLADSSLEMQDGFLYLIDAVADPQTRTFTLTLLLLNESTGPDESLPDIPRTDQAWRLDFSFLPGSKKGKTYVAEQAIHRDADGSFLWMIDNFQQRESMPKDRLLKVSKLRVDLGPVKIPFLGNWVFQEVVLLGDSFDPKVNLVVGKLTVADGDADDWNGDTVLVDRETRWKVRPGDLVMVDLSNEDLEPGYYVPMDAIVFASNRTFLMIAEPAPENNRTIVKRVEVRMIDNPDGTTSSQRRIESMDGSSLEDRQFVSQGAHYLRDGESVKIISAENAE